MISAFGWAAAAALCVLAIPAAAEQGGTAAESSAGRPAAAGTGTLPATGEPPPGPAAVAWTGEEIAAAQARCALLLKGLDVVAVPEAPIREGAACGTPAPMKLISLGRSPQVALSPPPTVTCDMILALHTWLHQDVQPLARAHLGAPVIRIETMSSYSCRNAYGRVNGRLSEHARANALDIGAFTATSADNVHIAADWGPTVREIAAAAKAAATRAASASLPGAGGPAQGIARTFGHARGQAAQGGNGGQANVGPALAQTHAPSQGSARAETQDATAPAVGGAEAPLLLGWQQPGAFSMPGLAVSFPTARAVPLVDTPPSHLGGPRSAGAPPAPAASADRMDFLRAAHHAACKIFGTVLGPEANSAHKNHFHLDMAERKVLAICE